MADAPKDRNHALHQSCRLSWYQPQLLLHNSIQSLVAFIKPMQASSTSLVTHALQLRVGKRFLWCGSTHATQCSAAATSEGQSALKTGVHIQG
jgi:hypothetical protein